MGVGGGSKRFDRVSYSPDGDLSVRAPESFSPTRPGVFGTLDLGSHGTSSVPSSRNSGVRGESQIPSPRTRETCYE